MRAKQPGITTTKFGDNAIVDVAVSFSNGQESDQNIITGIRLSMTPKISPEGQVEAELSISVSTPTGITSQKVPTFSGREDHARHKSPQINCQGAI